MAEQADAAPSKVASLRVRIPPRAPCTDPEPDGKAGGLHPPKSRFDPCRIHQVRVPLAQRQSARATCERSGVRPTGGAPLIRPPLAQQQSARPISGRPQGQHLEGGPSIRSIYHGTSSQTRVPDPQRAPGKSWSGLLSRPQPGQYRAGPPLIRTTSIEWQSSGLLIRQVGVQAPGGPPSASVAQWQRQQVESLRSRCSSHRRRTTHRYASGEAAGMSIR